MPFVNFFIFLAILVYFAKNPLRELAKKRNETFESHRKKALQAKDATEAKLIATQNRLASLDSEIEGLKKAAKEEVEQEARKILENGKLMSRQMLDEAKRSQEREFLSIQQRLKDEIAKTVQEALIHKVSHDLTKETDENFSSDKIKELRGLEEVGRV